MSSGSSGGEGGGSGEKRKGTSRGDVRAACL